MIAESAPPKITKALLTGPTIGAKKAAQRGCTKSPSAKNFTNKNIAAAFSHCATATIGVSKPDAKKLKSAKNFTAKSKLIKA